MLISCSQKSLASQKLYRVSGRTEILCHELHCLTKNMEEATPKVASKVRDLSLCLSTSTLVNGGNTTCNVSVLQNLPGIFSFEHLAKTPGKHPHGPNSSKKKHQDFSLKPPLTSPITYSQKPGNRNPSPTWRPGHPRSDIQKAEIAPPAATQSIHRKILFKKKRISQLNVRLQVSAPSQMLLPRRRRGSGRDHGKIMKWICLFRSAKFTQCVHSTPNIAKR